MKNSYLFLLAAFVITIFVPGVTLATISFTNWELQEPDGSGTNPDTITPTQLTDGYSDAYFYTASDGGQIFMDTATGITTSGSLHPRCEMREMSGGAGAAWAPTNTNILTVTGQVIEVGGGSSGHTTISQVFNSSLSIPLCEFIYDTGIGGFEILYEEGKGDGTYINMNTPMNLNTHYTYSLSLSEDVLTVTINGVQVYTHDPSATVLADQFYFKCGNYDQTAVAGAVSTTPYTEVEDYAINIFHGSGTPTLIATSAVSTPTATESFTPTSTLTATATFTDSPTATHTPTASTTPTLSPTKTFTATPTPTDTPTSANTSILTPTATLTSTSTATDTPTHTDSSTPTNTPIRTVTLVDTATQTSSFTATATNGFTSIFSPSATSSFIFTPTLVFTATVTSTPTDVFTVTPSLTRTPVLTPTPTFTSTATYTSTATATISWTPTFTFTSVPPTSSPTKTITPIMECLGIPDWNGNFVFYSVGQKAGYNGEVYQCIQANTSEPTGEPPLVLDLWKDMGPCGNTPTVALITQGPVVYPNPVTSSVVNLQLPMQNAKGVSIRIFTIALREIQKVTATQVMGDSMTIDLVDKTGISLANGLYYFMIQANGQRWVTKVLVLR